MANVSTVSVVDVEVSDVGRAVVAIHNVPGEGDMGAVPTGHLEVAKNFLGIYVHVLVKNDTIPFWWHMTCLSLPHL